MLTLFSILYSLFCVREYVVEDSKIYEMFCYKYKLLLNHIFFSNLNPIKALFLSTAFLFFVEIQIYLNYSPSV